MTTDGHVRTLTSRIGRTASRRLMAVASVALILVAMSATVTTAAPINLIPYPPDITSVFIGVNYDAGTNIFTANGFSSDLDLDGLAPPDYALDAFGSYSVTATVDENGELLGGSITITGEITALGFNSGTLLTGIFVPGTDKFGFIDGGGEIFELTFEVTGGDVATLYESGIGPKRGGTIINAVNSGFNGDLTQSFANDGFSGSSDTFPIPEPASMTIALLGMGFLLTGHFWRRRRRA